MIAVFKYFPTRQVPNKLFYRDQLIPAALEEDSHNLIGWRHLVNPQLPVIFHGVQGIASQEGSSPSWFNVDELTVVIDYVVKLLEDSDIPVLGEHIGIITPYQKQVMKIREALESMASGRVVMPSGNNQNNSRRRGFGSRVNDEFRKVQVGSCEQFQGKECRVIIISTVRSSVEHIKSDQQYNLGFVASPKRFNVSATRAQALLVLVGNPYLLEKDRCWEKMLRYCTENQAYRGWYFGLLIYLSINLVTLGCVWPSASASSSGAIESKEEGGNVQDDAFYDMLNDLKLG